MEAKEIRALRDIPYVIWGTGRIAQDFYEKYASQIGEPLYWVDSNPIKHGKELKGKKIIAPTKFYIESRNYYAQGK